ncbi:hypothetical protein [Serinicoccus profundi]|uniref:hypothetical protein n=1 Tax=Serinicoccus profundi TaxID=1078471 RepID=UPI000255F54D|nr:hypothetical protein [Serinicoccus profundi]
MSPAAEAGGVVLTRERGAELVAKARGQGRGSAVEQVVDQPQQRSLLIGMPAGGGLPEHDAPRAATLYCVSGAVSLIAGERRWELASGDLVPVPQERHRVEADVDSVCLLTVSRG